jgi:ribosome-binding protein aMBF1 (putative translation factor)
MKEQIHSMAFISDCECEHCGTTEEGYRVQVHLRRHILQLCTDCARDVYYAIGMKIDT